jgi:hypothetical protein
MHEEDETRPGWVDPICLGLSWGRDGAPDPGGSGGRDDVDEGHSRGVVVVDRKGKRGRGDSLLVRLGSSASTGSGGWSGRDRRALCCFNQEGVPGFDASQRAVLARRTERQARLAPVVSD